MSCKEEEYQRDMQALTYLVDLQLRLLLALSLLIRGPGTCQSCLTLTFQLNDNRSDSLIAGQVKDDPARDEVEICEM